MRFIYVTASGRESESNPLLQALVTSGARDLLVSYYFLNQRKEGAIDMYANLTTKRTTK